MKQIFEEEKPKNGEKYRLGIQYCSNPQNAQSPPHIHEYIELLYGISGEYYCMLDNKQHIFRPGDLVIINSWQVHDKHPESDPTGSHLVIKINPEMIYACYNTSAELRYALPFIFPDLIQNRVVQPVEIHDTLDYLVKEIKELRYGWELAAKSALYRIILWIIRNAVDQHQELGSYSESTINNISRAFSYIADHYQERLSVREIADHCYMGYSYFSKMFMEITQKSCTEYINYFRVQKAETLLLEGNQTITEISSQVGFDNVSYFIKQFRKFKGISPKQYQLNLQKSNWDEKES